MAAIQKQSCSQLFVLEGFFKVLRKYFVKILNNSQDLSKTVDFCPFMIKDYYKILKIEPTANGAEIKAAYRKMALEFHPDKNPGDRYAISQFYLVKEAYETLSSQTLKENYLKQRWLAKANNEQFETATNTPETILVRFLDANKKIHQFDAFRMDKKGLASELLSMLNGYNIALLNEFDETQVNTEIVRQAILASEVLQPADRKRIFEELKRIKSADAAAQAIHKAEKENNLHTLMNRLQPWLVALVVLLLCALIFMLSKPSA